MNDIKNVEQLPVAYQDKAKPYTIVLDVDWENIDPMWHWMYRPLYASPACALKYDMNTGRMIEVTLEAL